MHPTEVSALVEQFIHLSECPEQVAESAEPSEMLVTLWRHDAGACQALLQELVRRSVELRGIIDEIGIAQMEIDEDRFRRFLYALSKQQGVPPETKTRLQILLVSIGHSDAIREFDRNLRSGCNRFLKGQLDEMEWMSLVRQTCILRRRELWPTITGTLEKLSQIEGRRPYLHIDTERQIETMARALREGRAAAVEMLLSAESKVSQKEAAAFALGCECDPALYDVLVRSYTQHDGSADFPIRRECVGAIVYSARCADLLHFVASGLRRERERLARTGIRWPWSPNRDGDVLQLFLAATFSPEADGLLLEELHNWLHVREFRRQHFFFSDLMRLRGSAGPPSLNSQG